MEIEEVSQTHAINTILGYRKIVWIISNYFSGTCGNVSKIKGPTFCVQGPQLTKWRLYLTPRFRHGVYTSTMYLERCDSFPFDVEVKWKFCYPVEGDEVVIENCATFQGKSAFGTEIDAIIDIEHKLVIRNKRDDFVVRCFMIVYSADDRKLFERPSDSGLKSLSQDLLLLLKGRRDSDTTLCVPNEDPIDVHRAILCCRSNFFESLIRDDEIVDFVFPYGDIKAAKMMISFLYTGDLKYALRLPSFSIEKAIKCFNIDELKRYYSPSKLTIKTMFTVKETKFIWTVADLNRTTTGSIWSHSIRAVENEKICKVGLYPRGFSGTGEFMSVRVKFLRGIQPGRMCIYFGVVDINKKYGNVKMIRKFYSGYESISLRNFVSRHILRDPRYMVKERLKLFCRFRIFVGSVNKEVNDSDTCPVSINIDTHYGILSNQVASLYETGDYSDYTIECGVQRFKVHRMIISCRSHVLAAMVKNEANKSFLSLPDIEPNILDIILHYIYSGVLKKCEPDEILKIYDASKRFGILPLKNTCSETLQLNFGIQNAVEISIAAHEHKDRKLKSSAFKFICCNINDIKTQQCWQTLINEHSSLYNEWTEFSKSHTC